MFSFLVINHHLGYKPIRQYIAQILKNNDVVTARQKIDQVLLEHDRYKNIDTVNDNNVIADNRALHHAKDHIQYADIQTPQKDATIDALNEE